MPLFSLLNKKSPVQSQTEKPVSKQENHVVCFSIGKIIISVSLCIKNMKKRERKTPSRFQQIQFNQLSCSSDNNPFFIIIGVSIEIICPETNTFSTNLQEIHFCLVFRQHTVSKALFVGEATQFCYLFQFTKSVRIFFYQRQRSPF